MGTLAWASLISSSHRLHPAPARKPSPQRIQGIGPGGAAAGEEVWHARQRPLLPPLKSKRERSERRFGPPPSGCLRRFRRFVNVDADKARARDALFRSCLGWRGLASSRQRPLGAPACRRWADVRGVLWHHVGVAEGKMACRLYPQIRGASRHCAHEGRVADMRSPSMR